MPSTYLLAWLTSLTDLFGRIVARSKKVLALVAAFVENDILSSSSKGEMRDVCSRFLYSRLGMYTCFFVECTSRSLSVYWKRCQVRHLCRPSSGLREHLRHNDVTNDCSLTRAVDWISSILEEMSCVCTFSYSTEPLDKKRWHMSSLSSRDKNTFQMHASWGKDRDDGW